MVETWWTESSLRTYQGILCIYYKDRIGRGGGICVYVRNYYRSYMPNIDVFGADGCEQVCWCIITCGGEKDRLCGAIYRPPGYKTAACNTAILNSMRRLALTSMVSSFVETLTILL